MDRMELWQYYTSSYVRVEPTEGINRNAITKVLLNRNLDKDIDVEGMIVQPKALAFNEELPLRICVNTYKMLYQYPGSEYFIYTDNSLSTDPKTKVSTARERLHKVEAIRTQRFKEKFEMNTPWMKNLDHDEVSKITMEFKKWTEEGIPPNQSPKPAEDVEMLP